MPEPKRPPPTGIPDETLPCDQCGLIMVWTGQPSFSGPVRFRFFRCQTCGVRKIPVRREPADGWG